MVLIKYNINKTSSICRSRKVKQKGVCVLRSVGERSEVGLESELQNIRREREERKEGTKYYILSISLFSNRRHLGSLVEQFE